MTTWTIPIRLATVDLLPSMKLHKQTDEIRKPAGQLEFDDITVEILLSVSGRRLAPSAARAVAPSMWETLSGQLNSSSDEPQDAFTSTYGELLGLMLRIAQLGGHLDIVRIIESNEGPSPDYLLISRAGHGRTYHLLECKGSSVDHHAVQRTHGSSLYICESLAAQRNEARAQLDSRLAYGRFGNSVSVSKTGVLTLPAHSAAISCVSVPDGRMAAAWQQLLQPITTRACAKLTCSPCIVRRDAIPANPAPVIPASNPLMANVIAVMAEKRLLWIVGDPEGTELMERIKSLDKIANGPRDENGFPGIVGFLNRYGEFERLCWSECWPAAQEAFTRLNEWIDQYAVSPAKEGGDPPLELDLVWWVSAAKLARAGALFLAERSGLRVDELRVAYDALGRYVGEVQKVLLAGSDRNEPDEMTLLEWPQVAVRTGPVRQRLFSNMALREVARMPDLRVREFSFQSANMVGHVRVNGDGSRSFKGVETNLDTEAAQETLPELLDRFFGIDGRLAAPEITASRIKLSWEPRDIAPVSVGESFVIALQGRSVNGWRAVDGRWSGVIRVNPLG